MTYSQLLKTILICFFLQFAASVVKTEPLTNSKQVLIIHSYHSGLSWTDSIMNGISDVFYRNGYDAQMSAEYLDARRVIDPVKKSNIENFVISKIQGMNPDLVIVSDNAALIFILKYREHLFPEVPVIFCGINDFHEDMISNFHNITGIAEEVSVIETVNTVLHLHPATNKIIVLGRTSVAADKYNRDAFVANLQFLPAQIQVTFWDDPPYIELKERLEKLEQGTVLFLNGLIMNQDGRQLMYGETTRLVSGIAEVPVYSLWDVYLGYGIVGGMLISGYRQGELTGDIALHILKGENADNFSIVNGREANRYMFDYRQLKRFGIPLSKLPKNSFIINPPDSFYYKYKKTVWLTSLAILGMSGIIIFLIITILRRRKAEKLLLQANLVVENSLVVLFRWKAEEGWPVEYVSNNIIKWGYSVEELISGSIPFSLIIYPDDLERVSLEVGTHSASGIDRFKQEYRIVKKDGDIRWVNDLTVIERDANGRITHYQGIIIDITDRKKAEEALSQSEERLRQIAENIDSVFFVFELENGPGRFRYLNSAFQKISGMKTDYVLRHPLILNKLVHPDDLRNYLDFFKKIKEAGGIMKEMQFRINHKNGTIHWIKLKATSVNATDGHIMRIVGLADDVTERKHAEEKIRSSLKEKQILLQELYHRTKNNMQVISSMLSLQSEYTKNKKMTEIFKEMENRIHSMALIHKKLYESKDLSNINMREYIYELMDLLKNSYRISSDRISITYDMTDVHVLIDIAIPCGLILNELISNAFKHAFPKNSKGEINIKLNKTKDGIINLRIADNGTSASREFDLKTNSKLGLKIVLALVEYQLKGNINFNFDNGTVCLIQFKDIFYEARV